MIIKETLANGVRAIIEQVPHVRSVSIGIWVGTGSRDERAEVSGVAHFIEHLLFKGTAKRSAKEIAEVLEAVGGQLNAFTSKEYTCYHAKVLDEHVDLAMDVLTDIFFHSRLAAEDMECERRVILEEIKMYEDTPDEVVHDLLAETIWAGNSLGRSILGSVESITAMTPEMLRNHLETEYCADRVVVAVAGAVDPSRVLAVIRDAFAGMPARSPQCTRVLPEVTGATIFQYKDVEQVQLCLGAPGLPHEHKDIYALHVLNNVMGGGASSRLFQKIREERGMAYSVYSFHSAFSDVGLFGVYAGTSPAFVHDVFGLIIEEMVRIRHDGITAGELKRTQDQIKGSMYLGLESINSRMTRLGKGEICFQRYVPPEEIIEKIYQVTLDDVLQVARSLWVPERFTLSLVASADPGLNRLESMHKLGL
ncbi:M16 family metallopeptidase [Heliophilum fasciatum]|uniref:Putative Zn-dependent peptidase n=1 Tax=Heliophilum fasciatum TaxID=35700 RepID=A0A4R2RNB5_9FIRM|nr:pitrilysin family protein [Heliophilum fasciatum]MCW2277886.1 putative Zn-dependent peptidase [Heliophilum fasciatum]TCP64544.1 putative Zn-dependent peptidase [Heliophilum fasciatum]